MSAFTCGKNCPPMKRECDSTVAAPVIGKVEPGDADPRFPQGRLACVAGGGSEDHGDEGRNESREAHPPTRAAGTSSKSPRMLTARRRHAVKERRRLASENR